MQNQLVIYGSLSLFRSWLIEQNAKFNVQAEGIVDEMGRSWNTHLGSLTEVKEGTDLHLEGYCWPTETYSDIRPVINFSFVPIGEEEYALEITYLDQALNRLAHQFIEAVMQNWPYQSKLGKRLGGPIPTPEEERINIVKNWHKERGRVPQWSFCQRVGISTSTLRRWEKELERQGKL